jgi:LuxR family maltose regulon positive regulatory protein
MVPRTRLVRRLAASAHTPIVMVVAPAGYGKTTLLTEWAARDGRRFSWVPAADDDGDRALTAIARAIDASAATQQRHAVVVDDAHLAGTSFQRHALELASTAPPGVQVVLGSRRHPDLPLARLRAHRLVMEITAADLAMTRLEAAMLLDAAGVRLAAAQVDRLAERTGGWAAALYLAALSVAAQPELDLAVARFDGADRLVAEYLRTEVLAGASERQLAFLRQTSILDRLTPALCDAVIGADGSAEVLADLTRAGVPIEPLDRRDTAFRHHPLLATMLRAELRRSEPALEATLHRRAADWLGRHGEPARAIRHAAACRDGERAGRLLWALAPGYAGHGREALLGTWLEPFGDDELAARPQLALTAAVHHLAEGRRAQAQRATDAAERSLGADGAAELAPAVRMLRACVAPEGVRRMRHDAERAAAAAPPSSGCTSVARLLVGVAQHLGGDRDDARVQLEEGASQAAGRMPVVAALCQAQLALLAAEAGSWEDAERDAREAHATLEPLAGAAPARALVLAVYAVVATNRGEMAQARHDAADARRLLAQLPDFVPWLLAEAHVWLARAELRLSDGPTARMLLARAARVQARVADAPVLAQWVHEGWRLADAFAASATGDGPMLTNAELRVLRLLPSHMCFREIGERLHVSANTVKTQALAVYRKLDVSCRSDAVVRGRAAGLIDG